MRETKFRGKRKDNGEWVYGYYYELDCRSAGKKYIAYSIYQRDHQSFKVIPETVGQFTGLLDKNGKEIYAGDILDYYNPMHPHYSSPLNRKTVKWRSDKNTGVGFNIAIGTNYKIIGNITDNPDLLK